MSNVTLPRITNKTITYGNPYHGLNINGTLTLSNGDTVVRSIDASKRRFGDCYKIQVPGHTYTDQQPFGSHLKFEQYALSSGFEGKYLHDYKLNYGNKNTFIYCDANKDRWLVTVGASPGGTLTAFTLYVEVKKFGDFYAAPEIYTQWVTVGNPAITTPTMVGYKYEVVNVNKDGSLAIIGLCLEDTSTESGSTNIFDRQYGYPLAFIRLDITSKNNIAGSIYRSKTYCDRVIATNVPSNWLNSYDFNLYTRYWIDVPRAANNYIQTKTYDGTIKALVRKGGTIISGDLNLPADTPGIKTWGIDAIDQSGFKRVGVAPTGNYTLQARLIHVFIKDDNSLLDVEIQYEIDSLTYQFFYCTDDPHVQDSDATIISRVAQLASATTDNRVIYNGVTSGQLHAYFAPYQITESGSDHEFKLYIGGNEVDKIVTKSRSVTTQAYRELTKSTTTTDFISTAVGPIADNSYSGYYSGNITAIPTTGYQNYKGWMGRGKYTLDTGKVVAPFVQVYTNNLVGMVEGNEYYSKPDNAAWKTPDAGNIYIRKIFTNDGSIVGGIQEVEALKRYCSYQPHTKTFSGLYNVPVCYV